MVNELHAGSELLAIDYRPSDYDTDGTNIDNVSTTSFIAGSPVVSAEVVAATTGKLLCVVGGQVKGADRTHMGCQIREDDVSGAVVEEVQVTEHGYGGPRSTSSYISGSRATIYDGLDQAQTYFARHMYRNPSEPGTTGDLGFRQLALIPLPFPGAGVTPAIGAPIIPVDSALVGEPAGLVVPAAAWSSSVQSQLNLASTAYTRGEPDVGVQFIAPPSGKVLLMISGGARDNDATSANQRVFVSPQIYRGVDNSPHVFDLVLAASVTLNGWSCVNGTPAYMYGSRVSMIEGLTPGDAYYAEVQHTAVDWTSGNDTADLTVRDIGVIPLPEAAQWDADTTSITQISSASYATGSPEVGVGFTAPASGKVLCIIGGGGQDNTNDDRVFMSPQLFLGTSSAGTQVFSAATAEDERAYVTAGEASRFQYGSRLSVISGLTADASYYMRHRHRAADSSNTNNGQADLTVRDIGVVPIA